MEESVALDTTKQRKFVKSIKGIKKLIKVLHIVLSVYFGFEVMCTCLKISLDFLRKMILKSPKTL